MRIAQVCPDFCYYFCHVSCLLWPGCVALCVGRYKGLSEKDKRVNTQYAIVDFTHAQREPKQKSSTHISFFLSICEIPCFSFHPLVSRGSTRPQEPVAGLAEQRTGPDGRLVAATTWMETPIYIGT